MTIFGWVERLLNLFVVDAVQKTDPLENRSSERSDLSAVQFCVLLLLFNRVIQHVLVV